MTLSLRCFPAIIKVGASLILYHDKEPGIRIELTTLVLQINTGVQAVSAQGV
jgi:hypothetical protein